MHVGRYRGQLCSSQDSNSKTFPTFHCCPSTSCCTSTSCCCTSTSCCCTSTSCCCPSTFCCCTSTSCCCCTSTSSCCCWTSTSSCCCTSTSSYCCCTSTFCYCPSTSCCCCTSTSCCCSSKRIDLPEAWNPDEMPTSPPADIRHIQRCSEDCPGDGMWTVRILRQQQRDEGILERDHTSGRSPSC